MVSAFSWMIQVFFKGWDLGVERDMVAAAVESYNRTRGDYPASLDTLKQGFLLEPVRYSFTYAKYNGVIAKEKDQPELFFPCHNSFSVRLYYIRCFRPCSKHMIHIF